MLLKQKVVTKWNSKNKKKYVDAGYTFTKMKDDVSIDIKDLALGANVYVKVKCDYCGKEFKVLYLTRNSKTRSFLDKDACPDCLHEKIKESNLKVYGVKNPEQRPDVCEKTHKKLRHTFEFVEQEFSKRGYKLLPQKYNNAHQKLKYICPKHGLKEITYNGLSTGDGCMECGYEKNSGEGHFKWKGGTSRINKYLRGKISPWIADTIKEQHGKCIISGADSDVVHHIYGFSRIVDEVFSSTGIDVRKSMSDYSEYELKLLSEKCLQLHYKYGLGACLTEALHKEFHEKYGYGDNTKAQFEEFCKEHSS